MTSSARRKSSLIAALLAIPFGVFHAPNITPDRNSGIGAWSVSDLEYFFETGMLPEGDFVGGAMGPVIDDNTVRLTDQDRKAMAEYLKSLPARPSAAGDD